MLTDWECHELPKGMLADMSPRHAPEITFRPRRVNVRRDPYYSRVMIVRITGDRMFGKHADSTVLESWEWDCDRDPNMEWISDLIKWVNEQCR